MQPALDLISRIGALPRGDIFDLGCGTGSVGEVLCARWSGRSLHGVDSSASMREEAAAVGCYETLSDVDIATWQPGQPPALIFSNAALNWVPDHAVLVPRLARSLTVGGWLAIQMPAQHDAPSHALARSVAHDLFPAEFPDAEAHAHVQPAQRYAELLAPLGEVSVWETSYLQHMPAGESGHPVRMFTQSTYLRPYLAPLAARDQTRYLAAYDAALVSAYPLLPDGSVWMPFRRLFVLLQVPQ